MPAVEVDDLEGIADNLIARIAAEVTDIATVDELGAPEDVIRAIRKGPCCFLVFEDENFSDDSDLAETIFQQGKHFWQLYILTSSSAGPRAARGGAKGTYRLSTLVKRALTGYDPIADTEGGSYPIKWLGRKYFESEDASDYLMVARIGYDIENQEI